MTVFDVVADQSCCRNVPFTSNEIGRRMHGSERDVLLSMSVEL